MTLNKLTIFSSLITCIIFSGCKKWDKEEAIPAYIKISHCILSCDSVTQGSSRHNISDVWVNIDGNRQGTYEIPVIFPILTEGTHTITIRAGVKLNGISASREVDPFLSFLNFDTTFTPQNVLVLTPVFTYKPATIFAWREDFQGNGFQLDPVSDTDTSLFIESDSLNPAQHYGIFHIDTGRPVFHYQSAEAFELPSNNTAIYLEFDYQCNHPLVVGLQVNNLQTSVGTPILALNPHPNSFNHVYVDLSYTATQNPNALDFNIFFGAYLQSGYLKGDIKIDNIKLLHF